MISPHPSNSLYDSALVPACLPTQPADCFPTLQLPFLVKKTEMFHLGNLEYAHGKKDVTDKHLKK